MDCREKAGRLLRAGRRMRTERGRRRGREAWRGAVVVSEGGHSLFFFSFLVLGANFSCYGSGCSDPKGKTGARFYPTSVVISAW